jgi:hypothetical protein
MYGLSTREFICMCAAGFFILLAVFGGIICGVALSGSITRSKLDAAAFGGMLLNVAIVGMIASVILGKMEL